MAYLGDPREGRIGPNGELWEMDNRVEKRYYWNGAYLDLCNMDPKDATNRVVNVRVVDGDISVKATNKITLSSETVSGNIYQLKAISEKPVDSDIVIVCDYTATDSDGKTITGKATIKMAKGTTEGTTEITGVGTVKTITVDTKVGSSEDSATGKSYSDDKYKYTVSDLNKEETTSIPMYWGIYPYSKDINDVTINVLNGYAEESLYDEYPIEFVIPKVEKDFDSFDEAIAASYKLVIAIPEEYTSKIRIEDSTKVDNTMYFTKMNFTKDNMAFLARTEDEDTTLAPTIYEQIFGFTITIK